VSANAAQAQSSPSIVSEMAAGSTGDGSKALCDISDNKRAGPAQKTDYVRVTDAARASQRSFSTFSGAEANINMSVPSHRREWTAANRARACRADERCYRHMVLPKPEQAASAPYVILRTTRPSAAGAADALASPVSENAPCMVRPARGRVMGAQKGARAEAKWMQ
jgi:hypothetical protein